MSILEIRHENQIIIARFNQKDLKKKDIKNFIVKRNDKERLENKNILDKRMKTFNSQGEKMNIKQKIDKRKGVKNERNEWRRKQ